MGRTINMTEVMHVLEEYRYESEFSDLLFKKIHLIKYFTIARQVPYVKLFKCL